MTLPTTVEDPIARELEAAIQGRYRLERELGRGGMGAVFLARDLQLDRLVAIKVLPPEMAVRPELRERFLRETRTAASFSHPNIVGVHAVEESPGLLFFVMSFVEGETLTQRVKRQGPLPVPDAIRFLQEMAWALSYAHGRGVVHRDIKPDNILLERSTGRALVMDFGIARSVAATGLTQVGEAIGTPHFMSPEQAAGDTVDGRSDLYSLGVVGYFALTGRLPFDGLSAQAVMVAHISQPVLPIGRFRPDLPQPLAAAIERCLAKAPNDRFPSGEALVEALEQVRGRQVEINPAVRVWTVRADQFLRNGLILALLLPQMIRFGMQAAQVAFTSVILLIVVPALWSQIPLGMRELARSGLGYADLRNGILAIDVEREAVLAAARADPRVLRRRRRNWLILLSGFVLSISIIAIAWSGRVPKPTGGYTVSSNGLIALFVGLCLFMACVVFSAATLASSGRLDRRIHGLWTGRTGRFLFRLASWRMEESGAHSVLASGGHGAMTLLHTLPPETRKRLGSARATLARLEAELDRLAGRDAELESAAAETRTQTSSLAAASSDRHRALQEDLDRARLETATRRAAVLATLENVRLALVRVKGKLGTAEDVERELSEAESLLGSGR